MPNLATLEPAAPAEHPAREERRPVSLPGWLTRPGQEAKAHDFVIDNMSYGGCRLQTAAPLERGDAVDLTVLRRGAIPGVVRWHNAYGIGVSFAPELPERIETPRKVERVPVQTALAVRQTGRRPRSVPATNLSRFGCCLTFDDLPVAGEWVWVAMPGLAPIEARVRWADGRRAGVEFVHPIHASVLDMLLQRCAAGNA
ncbi:PilZ domain-containing protein [Sphingomonas kaistensis]|uniref:PilZ domain-containing protein n=1 Tax=Sphingomonas kaistensis TaxID=298708 RepID=A0ABZ2G0M8_9SPHN